MKRCVIALLALFAFVDVVWAGGPDVLAPNAEAVPRHKSRYITMAPVNAGQLTALRVKLVSLYHPLTIPRDKPDYSAFEGQ